MNNPPDRVRDDRRMHQGEKPGLDQPIDKARQEDVTPVRGDRGGSPIPDRDRPTILESDVEKRSNA